MKHDETWGEWLLNVAKVALVTASVIAVYAGAQMLFAWLFPGCPN